MINCHFIQIIRVHNRHQNRNNHRALFPRWPPRSRVWSPALARLKKRTCLFKLTVHRQTIKAQTKKKKNPHNSMFIKFGLFSFWGFYWRYPHSKKVFTLNRKTRNFAFNVSRTISSPLLVDRVPLHPEVDGGQRGVQVLVRHLANVGKLLIQRGEEPNKHNFQQHNP